MLSCSYKQFFIILYRFERKTNEEKQTKKEKVLHKEKYSVITFYNQWESHT